MPDQIRKGLGHDGKLGLSSRTPWDPLGSTRPLPTFGTSLDPPEPLGIQETHRDHWYSRDVICGKYFLGTTVSFLHFIFFLFENIENITLEECCRSQILYTIKTLTCNSKSATERVPLRHFSL